jgi:hypothetical protein
MLHHVLTSTAAWVLPATAAAVTPLFVNALAFNHTVTHHVVLRYAVLCRAVLCCRIVYLPGLEEEDLLLEDIIRDGHMMLMPRR